MTPWASSGQSARSSSRTVLSRRRASVGSRAVTDAARGCGHERRELTDRRARAQFDERLLAAVHADASFDDGEQVCLDRPLFDEHVPGSDAHLGRHLGHGGEHATGNAREQIDAMERGDSLDEAE